MTLDRQAIEKKDFPIARRGYDPDAVDAHLTEVAGQIAALQQGGGKPGGPRESLALAASRQVQLIVEAAESSAAEIESSARAEADRIRSEAASDAQRERDEATRKAQEHVGEVREATSLMLQRVDAMEGELGALIESLRTGAHRLTADLSLLQGNLGELQTAATGAAAPAPTDAGLFQPTSGRAERRAAEQAASVEAQPPSAPAAPVPVSEPEPEPLPAAFAEPDPEPDGAPAQDDGDVEGARLIALNMALNGSPREETDVYLRDNFDLTDRDGLLDEVYATVGG